MLACYLNMIDKNKAETCLWNMLVKGVYLCETPYCCTSPSVGDLEITDRGKSSTAADFPKSVEQNCSENNHCPKKHRRVPRGGRVMKKEIKLNYV